MKIYNTFRFIVVAFIFISIYSCTSTTLTEISPTGETPFRKATKFKYNNHSFISFSKSIYSEGLGVVHDPDCECVKK